jgi:DNA-binding LacI/PurR family transcriptional regulator
LAGVFAFCQAAKELRNMAGSSIIDSPHFVHSQSIWAACALLPAMTSHGPTALIAPNDDIAEWYVRPWLMSLGLSIPGDMSLISFDNKRKHLGMDLTTVDFGFGSLGYQAFHLLLGSITRPRSGMVWPKAKVVDRGSATPPPRRGPPGV